MTCQDMIQLQPNTAAAGPWKLWQRGVTAISNLPPVLSTRDKKDPAHVRPSPLMKKNLLHLIFFLA
uniref:Uncharacterized protein n=1 Tax=Anguilla anguilla TaxID=7936 RepID=A0A0E9S498_ANGAN